MATAEMTDLKDLFVEQLQDLYSAERQVIEALPEMIEHTTNDELRSALEEHLEVTREQASRLEKIFEGVRANPGGHECDGMKGIIQENEEVLEKHGDADVIDAGIIAGAQRVEHYEIAGYGTARTYAERLGESEAADLLGRTLDEESEADEKLTAIAERIVNPKARSGAAT